MKLFLVEVPVIVLAASILLASSGAFAGGKRDKGKDKPPPPPPPVKCQANFSISGTFQGVAPCADQCNISGTVLPGSDLSGCKVINNSGTVSTNNPNASTNSSGTVLYVPGPPKKQVKDYGDYDDDPHW